MSETHDLRYPVGPQNIPANITPDDIRGAMQDIAELPEQIREAVRGLSEDQLDTPYREGGWTVRQVVHHVGDSHMTAFHRVRRALTEDWPEIHGYNEKLFAELGDRTAPVEWSLDAIEGTHARWVMMLEHMQEADWQRGFRHSERGSQTLAHATMLYAWHSRHHVAHITGLRARMGW